MTQIWAYADITISTNLARDLGTRIVAAIFYGGGKHRSCEATVRERCSLLTFIL